MNRQLPVFPTGVVSMPMAGMARRPRAREAKDERQLVREAGNGSEDALEALFTLHWPRAHRAAYLIVRDPCAAEDIAQEAFIAAIRNLDRFDRSRPFGPWLHRIVANRSIDWVRLRKLRREAIYTEDAVEERFPGGSVEDQVGGAVSSELLEALGRLSPEHRAVIVLRYLLDHTPGEIASTLDLPRGTVNSRLRRGLDQLADAYSVDAGGEPR